MEIYFKTKEQPQSVHRVSLEFNSIKIEKKKGKITFIIIYHAILLRVCVCLSIKLSYINTYVR